MLDIINLDHYTNEPMELLALAMNLKTLSQYAENKAKTMQLRLEGKIEIARKHEEMCEVLYESLPEELQW